MAARGPKSQEVIGERGFEMGRGLNGPVDCNLLSVGLEAAPSSIVG